MLNIGLKYHKFFFFAKIKATSKYKTRGQWRGKIICITRLFNAICAAHHRFNVTSFHSQHSMTHAVICFIFAENITDPNEKFSGYQKQ